MIDLSVELVVLVYPQLGVGKSDERNNKYVVGGYRPCIRQIRFRSDRYPEFHV